MKSSIITKYQPKKLFECQPGITFSFYKCYQWDQKYKEYYLDVSWIDESSEKSCGCIFYLENINKREAEVEVLYVSCIYHMLRLTRVSGEIIKLKNKKIIVRPYADVAQLD